MQQWNGLKIKHLIQNFSALFVYVRGFSHKMETSAPLQHLPGVMFCGCNQEV